MNERFKLKSAVFMLFVKWTEGNEQELLLMRRQNTGHEDGRLGLPSGHQEKGESPLQAVIRETREEIGVSVESKYLSLVHTQFNHETNQDGDYINLYYLFIPFDGWIGEPRIMEADKCSELYWAKLGREVRLPPDTISYVRTAVLGILERRSYSEVEYPERA